MRWGRVDIVPFYVTGVINLFTLLVIKFKSGSTSHFGVRMRFSEEILREFCPNFFGFNFAGGMQSGNLPCKGPHHTDDNHKFSSPKSAWVSKFFAIRIWLVFCHDERGAKYNPNYQQNFLKNHIPIFTPWESLLVWESFPTGKPYIWQRTEY